MMETAFDSIRDTYEYEDFKEIVDHGCESGVCHQHIYYGDTIKFFETYEDEIIEYITDTLGSDMNEDLWTKNTCNYKGYMNDTVWAFIELVASSVVDDVEEQEINDDKVVSNYMKEEISNNGYTKSDLEYVMFGGNPPRSLTDSRYSQT